MVRLTLNLSRSIEVLIAHANGPIFLWLYIEGPWILIRYIEAEIQGEDDGDELVPSKWEQEKWSKPGVVDIIQLAFYDCI